MTKEAGTSRMWQVDHRHQHAMYLMEATRFDYITCLELIMTYMNQSRSLLKTINAMMEAKDYEGLLGCLHQLKGASSEIRLESVLENIRDAEQRIRSEEYDTCSIVIGVLNHQPIFN